MSGIKKVILFAAAVFVISLVYYVYAYTAYPPIPENETFWTEVGEGFGEIGLYGLLFIYARTLLKIILGKGAIAHRLLPDYSPDLSIPLFNKIGLGYVYCDKFIEYDQAIKELEICYPDTEINPVKHIKFEAGRLENMWHKN